MDFLNHLLDAPLANILVVAGLLFLGVAAVGKVVGKIEPDKTGRILSGVLGIVLLAAGVVTHIRGDSAKGASTSAQQGEPATQRGTTDGEKSMLTSFVSVVEATEPVAYFRLETTAGKSEVGDAAYSSSSGVSSSSPGAPIGVSDNHCAVLNGSNGKIITTLTGEIGSAGSLMVWVNLATLPSMAGHPFYLAGESQSHNDFDLEFETDDTLRFYTGGGDNVTFRPDAAKLVNQWHLVVGTFDTRSQIRTLFWDGVAVQTDSHAGLPNKTGLLSIGDSTVFKGRFFHGSLDEVAVWNRALDPSAVAKIHESAGLHTP